MKKLLKIVLIVVVLFMVVGIFMGGDDSETNPNSNNNTQLEEKIEYIKYNANEMLGDLDKNALNAQKKYLDQYVEVTGKLSTIDSSGDYICIERTDEEFAFINIQCYIQNDEQLDVVSTLSQGDKITVRGKITDVGEVLGYFLDIDEILE